MKNILVARVDDRLIHGQVMTAWIKNYPINKILIVDDELAKNQLMLNIYKAAVPAGITLQVAARNGSEEILGQPVAAGENYMVLAKTPEVFEHLINCGITFSTLVVGGMGAKPGRKTLYRNLSASEEEKACMKRLEEKGVRVVYQMVPVDREVALGPML